MTKCPFKFLDSYTEKDINYFFGRVSETNVLYDFVEKNRVVLVYGPLGTGKTSLVRCGLEQKYGSVNWCPVMIRRAENINISLLARLNEKLPERRRNAVIEKSKGNHLVLQLVEAIAAYTIAPVFLVFDQFEEFLLFANEDEKRMFADILMLFKNTENLTSCNIILVMREEFFGLLDKFEKEIPGLSDRRLRVDPMQPEDIKKTILDTLDYADFNISLQEKKDENIQRIFDALADKKGEVSLPNLQIYLDGLWRDDYARTYPDGYAGDGFPPLEFTATEIEKFGQIQDVLERFLTERKKKIALELKEVFPGTGENFLNLLLNEFISAFGTKIPVGFKGVEGEFFCPDIEEKFLGKEPPGVVKRAIKKLVDNKILRIESSTIELWHDSLAKLIDNQRDSKERKWIRIRVSIQSYMKEKDESLSFDEVKAWEKEIDNCGLSSEEIAFFNKVKQLRFEEEKERLFKNEMLQNEEKLRIAVQRKEEEVKKRLAEKEAELEIASAKQEAAFNLRRHKRTKMLFFLAAVIIVILFLGYVKLRESTNKLYAYDYFSRTISNIPDKSEALKLSGFIYEKIEGYDDSTKTEIQKYIVKLANDPEILKKRGGFEKILLSDKPYTVKKNIDISASGRFLVVQNDSTVSDAPNKNFSLFDIIGEKQTVSFSDVYYAYFLSHTDTLILSTVSKGSGRSGIDNPNEFILFDCKNGRVFGRYNVKDIDNSNGNFLYGADFLTSHRYTNYDSYDIRLTRSGNLLVPFLKLENGEKRNWIALLDKKGHCIRQPFISDFSTSISKDFQYIMIGLKADINKMKILREDGTDLKFDAGQFEFADFTIDNAIVYSDANRLFLTSSLDSSKEIKTINVFTIQQSSIDYAYADKRMRCQ